MSNYSKQFFIYSRVKCVPLLINSGRTNPDSHHPPEAEATPRMEFFKSSMLNVLVAAWIFSYYRLPAADAGHQGPYVPAIFIFGDSLADAGTNNYIFNCSARANFMPYGISFFPQPTGRFTNGRTAFDFIATYLGLPFPPPFLKPKANFSTGINFASGGAGLLDSTGAQANIIPLSHQITQFKHQFYILLKKLRSKSLHGEQKVKSDLGKSLYCISIGGNDIGAYIANTTFQNTTTPQQFVTMLLTKFDEDVVSLYSAGARKFLVLGIPPVGCTPYTKFQGYNISKGSCMQDANRLVVAYNTALNSLVDHLNQKLEGVTIIRLNTYDFLMNILENGEAYGFTDTKSACCGSGMFNAEVSCGKTSPQMLFCNDTDKNVFWDGTHPTQKVYAMFSHQIWSGNSSISYPFNLSTMVMGENN